MRCSQYYYYCFCCCYYFLHTFTAVKSYNTHNCVYEAELINHQMKVWLNIQMFESQWKVWVSDVSIMEKSFEMRRTGRTLVVGSISWNSKHGEHESPWPTPEGLCLITTGCGSKGLCRSDMACLYVEVTYDMNQNISRFFVLKLVSFCFFS